MKQTKGVIKGECEHCGRYTILDEISLLCVKCDKKMERD
jgi:Zn finger protein HypA/HybF involved in hydrogenase expression